MKENVSMASSHDNHEKENSMHHEGPLNLSGRDLSKLVLPGVGILRVGLCE